MANSRDNALSAMKGLGSLLGTNKIENGKFKVVPAKRVFRMLTGDSLIGIREGRFIRLEESIMWLVLEVLVCM